MKTVFVRPERCLGCRQCEFACAVAHSRSHDPWRAHLEEPLPRPRIHVEAGPAPHTAFPNRCRHCDPAPCVAVCPTAAMARDAGREAVLVDGRKCIACALCAMVCPVGAIAFHPAPNGAGPRVTALKCDACVDRPAAFKLPACVYACRTGALVYGELNELVREGRIRESQAVFARESLPRADVPETVASWRQTAGPATRFAGPQQSGGGR